MIPLDGFVTPQQAPLTEFPLPTPHRAYYRDGDNEPTSAGIEHVEVTVGDSEVFARGNASGLEAVLEVREAYGVVMLDTLIIPGVTVPDWTRKKGESGLWRECL